MPVGKDRDLEDTWKPEELERSLKGTGDKKRRDKNKSKDDRGDDERKHRKKREDADGGSRDQRERREKKHREEDKDERRRRRHDDEDEEVRRRKKEERRRREEEDDDDKRKRRDDKKRPKEENGDDRERRRRHRDENDEGEKRRRHKEENGDDGERRRRHRDEDNEKKQRRHRDDDDERRRRHRDKDGDRDKERRRHRDEDDDRKHRRQRDDGDDRKQRRHRDEDEDKRRRHRDDKDDSERRRRHRDDDDKRRKPKTEEDDDDDERRRRHRRHREEEDEDDDRHHRRRHHEDSDEEERKRKGKEKKRQEEKEKMEEEERKKKTPPKQSPDPEPAEVNGDNDGGYDDYEDDFEDYEDDFEDDDGDANDDDDDDDDDSSHHDVKQKTTGEMDEILEAMNRENERLLAESKKNKWSSSPDPPEEYDRRSRPKVSKSHTFINFVSAKQRQVTEQTANKTRRRGRELLKILELDMAAYDMFDMPPVREYDLYMRSYGRSNAKQAYVQTNEDNIERDVQTEEIEYAEKWTQHPPEEARACGGPGANADDDEHQRFAHRQTDSVRLNKFLQQAGQTMAILLEEDLAERTQVDLSRKQSNICVSENFAQLGEVPLLKDRHAIFSHFSPVQTHLLLTVYNSPEVPDTTIDKCGVICLWNVNEPSRPQKILVCESQLTCCCFSPVKASYVFAGTVDGALVVWDLGEPRSMHRLHKDQLLRYPTYNTAGVLDYENHQSAVVSVVPVMQAGGDSIQSLSLDGDSSEGLSFQIASVEENSVLNFWVVAEISNPDPSGSESDLGLAPGGRIKLLKSSSVILNSPLRDKRTRTTMRSYDMQVNPRDPNHFYIATDTGSVIHSVRYGGKVLPKAHKSDIDALVQVRSIDFSPFSEPCFLAGCADGSLRLYSTHSEKPVITWPDATEGRAIKCVRWCRSRPSVFFVLDESSTLYIWDLNMSDAVPMREESIAKYRVTSLSLSNDHSATGIGSPGRRPLMCVTLDSGAIELHTVSQEFSALMPEEVDQFAVMLQSVM